MEDIKDPKKESNTEVKELKRLFDSYVSVLTHKLGRTPTSDEIVSAMGNEEKPEMVNGQPAEPLHKPEEAVQPTIEEPQINNEEDDAPAILKYMIFHGTKSNQKGEKEPDPYNVLYYKSPDNRFFDVENREWMDKEPTVARHLPCRALEDRVSETGVPLDLFQSIVHGVMDEKDYDKLDKSGLLDDTCRRMYTHMSDLSKKMKEYDDAFPLDKSLDAEPIKNTQNLEEDPWVAAKYARYAPEADDREFTEEDNISPLDELFGDDDIINVPDEFMREMGIDDSDVNLESPPAPPAEAPQKIKEGVEGPAPLSANLEQQVESIVQRIMNRFFSKK